LRPKLPSFSGQRQADPLSAGARVKNRAKSLPATSPEFASSWTGLLMLALPWCRSSRTRAPMQRSRSSNLTSLCRTGHRNEIGRVRRDNNSVSNSSRSELCPGLCKSDLLYSIHCNDNHALRVMRVLIQFFRLPCAVTCVTVPRSLFRCWSTGDTDPRACAASRFLTRDVSGRGGL